MAKATTRPSSQPRFLVAGHASKGNRTNSSLVLAVLAGHLMSLKPGDMPPHAARPPASQAHGRGRAVALGIWQDEYRDSYSPPPFRCATDCRPRGLFR